VTGEVLPDGQMGELVFTTLTKEGLPMVRYRTRDLTRILPGTARSMRRIEKITGRSDDMIILRGVNVFPTQIEEQLFKCAGLAPHFQIELVSAGRMDAMVVHVEATAAMSSADARAALAKELSHHIKSVVGISTKIEVHDPGKVARSEGKAKRVVDNRKA
jgi:phenylacetate-CoA ligase